MVEQKMVLLEASSTCPSRGTRNRRRASSRSRFVRRPRAGTRPPRPRRRLRRGGGVQEQVEPALEQVAHFGEDTLEVVVRTDVTGGDERRADRLGQLAHVLLDPLALVGEGELGAALSETARDRPGDRAAVRNAE